MAVLTGKDYTDEEVQRAGLSIMRFLIAKKSQKMETGQTPKDEYTG